jgi:hypothetical protein
VTQDGPRRSSNGDRIKINAAEEDQLRDGLMMDDDDDDETLKSLIGRALDSFGGLYSFGTKLLFLKYSKFIWA